MDPQRKHLFGVLLLPPRARTLESRLDHITMAAFDLARANRQAFRQRPLIIQMLPLVAQVTVASSHRRFFFFPSLWLQMRAQGRQYLFQTILLQSLLLHLPPRRGRERLDLLSGRAQVLADVIEIQQVARLLAE